MSEELEFLEVRPQTTVSYSRTFNLGNYENEKLPKRLATCAIGSTPTVEGSNNSKNGSAKLVSRCPLSNVLSLY